MASIFEFIIPGHPPSVNNLFPNKRIGVGRRSSAAYVAWQRVVGRICSLRQDKTLLRAQKGRAYKLTVEVVASTWMTKTGGIQKPDTPNFIKAAEDPICKIWKWDDSFNVETTARKATSEGGEDFTIVRFEFL